MALDAFAAEVLRVPLDPSRIAVMTVQGTNIPYLEAHDVIREANLVFGPGGWGFEIVGQPWIVESGEQGQNKTHYEVWAVIGRLTVEGCPPMTDIGTNVRQGTGSSGLEMAIKGAASDAIKRCLRLYGDRFGLVLYDRDAGRDDIAERWHAYQQSQRGVAQAERRVSGYPEDVGSNPATATPTTTQETREQPERKLITKSEVTAVCTRVKCGFGIVGGFLAQKQAPVNMTDAQFAEWAASAEAQAYTPEKLVYMALRYMENSAALEATRTAAAESRMMLHAEINERKQLVVTAHD